MESTITRWHPIADLSELIDQALTRLGDGNGWNPRIDVVKKEGELVLRADLPGVKPDEVEVEVEDGGPNRFGRARGEDRGEGGALSAPRAPFRLILALDGPAGGSEVRRHRGHHHRWRPRAQDPGAGAQGEADQDGQGRSEERITGSTK
jgi:hypothetical protein